MRIKLEILSGEGGSGHGEATFDLDEADFKEDAEFKAKIIELNKEAERLARQWDIEGASDNTAFVAVTLLDRDTPENEAFLRKIEQFVTDI